jgi:hypothetical protein
MKKLSSLVLLLACYLTFPITLRAQAASSGQAFTISIAADHSQVRVGSNVCVKLSLTNNSIQDLHLDGGASGYTGLDPNFRFEVRDANGNLVPDRLGAHPEIYPRARFNYTIKPNETHSQDQCPSAQYDMSAPGKYTVQAFRAPSDNGSEIGSNIVAVTVLPTTSTSGQPPFAIVIAPLNSSFQAGSDVCVRIMLTNNSGRALDMVHGAFSGIDEGEFRLEVHDSSGNLIPAVYSSSPPTTGAMQGGTLAPNGIQSVQECPSKLHNMTTPGEYTLQAFRSIPGNPKSGEIGSNIVTVTVEP